MWCVSFYILFQIVSGETVPLVKFCCLTGEYVITYFLFPFSVYYQYVHNFGHWVCILIVSTIYNFCITHFLSLTSYKLSKDRLYILITYVLFCITNYVYFILYVYTSQWTCSQNPISNRDFTLSLLTLVLISLGNLYKYYKKNKFPLL